eukprot:TRINITY_DN2150_c0_g1_i1.p1 TRINITY_DN2150_c0_g1~~TRINITY_DN2150_c0_g1_i1.p1  ORF type:complete len:945 (+),score=198.15 TRINITY_DN2150_c0_g1_i1:205-3039(+)
MARIFPQMSGDGVSSCGSSSDQETPSLAIFGMRSVQWRINLGVLPETSSIDKLRRAAANGRRKYADLRRRLLVDPHISEESQKGSDLSLDNPLSQNPDSVWGQFFKNAEVERTIENDLSRLYPEHGGYFQSPRCQAILKRILLLWSLKHPNHGYCQGMHELLGPLMYVLHIDVMHLLRIKNLYEDLFDDRFEDMQFHGSDLSPRQHLGGQAGATAFRKSQTKVEEDLCLINSNANVESIGAEEEVDKMKRSSEIDDDIMSIFLGSDAYGAEGELGALLSLRFMEHDAYCMFDALLSGHGGAVAMADYFVKLPATSSHSGLPPVIEASSDIYLLLAVSDASLYNHLVSLGVEPQYFALRWLRVLFGREFSLEDLLLVWDSIFASPNTRIHFNADSIFGNNIDHSTRSIFISGIAVSMILHLRPALLATPNATTCLQKLLNFPRNADVGKLIGKAKLVQDLALDANCISPICSITSPFDDAVVTRKLSRALSASSSFKNKTTVSQHQYSGPCSPSKLRVTVSESYWEQKWKNSMLQRADSEGSSSNVGELSASKTGRNLGQPEPNPSNPSEAHDRESGNCSPPSPLLHNMASKGRSVGSFRKATRRKLLDDKPENQDSTVISNIDGTESRSLYEGHSSDTKDNGSENRAKKKESCEILVKRLNSTGDRLSECRGASILTESGSLTSDTCTITTDNSEVSSFPSTDDGLDTASTVSPLKKPKEKEIKSDAPRGKGNSEEGKKTKFSTSSLPGKFMWFWNFGRNNANNSDKSSAEISKSEQLNESTNHNCESTEKGAAHEKKSSTDSSSLSVGSQIDIDQASCSSITLKQNQIQEDLPGLSVSASQDSEGEQASCSSRGDAENLADSSESRAPGSLKEHATCVSVGLSNQNLALSNSQEPFVDSCRSTSLSNKANDSLVNLQTLGQSMLENIQVSFPKTDPFEAFTSV